MTRSIEEQLSALLDSELPIEEEELLLKRLESGSEHRRTLGRYALVGDLIRGTSVNRGTLGLSESVSAAVASEQAHAARETGARSFGLRKGLAGAAIAASVALLALFNFDVLQNLGTPTQAPVIARSVSDQSAAAVTRISYTVPPASAGNNVIAPARLTNYLVSHSEYSNSLSRQVMDSYIVNQMPESDIGAPAASGLEDRSFD